MTCALPTPGKYTQIGCAMYTREFSELSIKIARAMAFLYHFIFGVHYGGNMAAIVYNYNPV